MAKPVLHDKHCSKCNTRKDKSEFYGKTIKSGYCKACQAQGQKDRRIFLNEYLKTHPCVDCGESRLPTLEFDHQENKKYNVMEMVRFNFTEKKLLSEIEKCEVRCANCHRMKTSVQFGWTYKVD